MKLKFLTRGIVVTVFDYEYDHIDASGGTLLVQGPKDKQILLPEPMSDYLFKKTLWLKELNPANITSTLHPLETFPTQHPP